MIEKDGVFTFEEEPVRVIVTVPTELRNLKVVERPLGLLMDYRAGVEFQPKRLVINFELVDRQTGEAKKEFTSVIELKVYFTHKDIDSVTIEKLALAFWDGVKWVRFKKAKETWKVEKVPINNDPIWAGYFEIEFDKWGDPPMALGN